MKLRNPGCGVCGCPLQRVSGSWADKASEFMGRRMDPRSLDTALVAHAMTVHDELPELPELVDLKVRG